MATVTTSIVVQFGQTDVGGILTAEIDGRPDGLNAGKTSFAPGDVPKFLVFKSSDVTVDLVTSSIGINAITALGTGLYDVGTDDDPLWLTFADSAEADLPKPFYSTFAYEWYGNNLGIPTVTNAKLTVPNKGVGVLKVSYKSQYLSYSLASPASMNGKQEFQIVVFVQGHN